VSTFCKHISKEVLNTVPCFYFQNFHTFIWCH